MGKEKQDRTVGRLRMIEKKVGDQEDNSVWVFFF